MAAETPTPLVPNEFAVAWDAIVAPRAAKGRVEVVVAQAIEQRLRLEQAAAALGVERDGVRTGRNRRLIAPHQKLRADRARHLVAKRNHLSKLEAGINM